MKRLRSIVTIICATAALWESIQAYRRSPGPAVAYGSFLRRQSSHWLHDLSGSEPGFSLHLWSPWSMHVYALNFYFPNDSPPDS